MAGRSATEVPVLRTPLQPGDGNYITLVVDFAKEYKRSKNKEKWAPFVSYVKSAKVSPVARTLGLYILGETQGKPVKKEVKALGDWYLRVTDKEKQLATRFFGTELP